MAGSPSLLTLRARWLCASLCLPILAVQAKGVRKTALQLGDAKGPTSGEISGSSAGPVIQLTVLGESTVSGVGASSHQTSLAGQTACQLARQLRAVVQWKAVGRSGATVSKVNRELLSQVPAGQDAVVVALGANDTFRLTSLRKWKSGLTALIDGLNAKGTKRIFISKVPPVGHFSGLPWPTRAIAGVRSDLLGAVLVRILEERADVEYCPIEFPTADLCADGIHPSERGYAEWGRQLSLLMAKGWERGSVGKSLAGEGALPGALSMS